MAATSIRPGRAEDAEFVARTILLAQRGPAPRGWFDIALDRPEPQVLEFLGRLAIAPSRSWYHVKQFLIAEVEGRPAAALCAMPSRETRECEVELGHADVQVFGHASVEQRRRYAATDEFALRLVQLVENDAFEARQTVAHVG